MTCISIDAPDDAILVQIAFPGHTRGEKTEPKRKEK
jgi:hypothetical protein